jgi:hypothetical protein
VTLQVQGKRKRGPQRNIGWAYVDKETGADISPETVEATATAISETPTAAGTAAAAAASTTAAANTTGAAITSDAASTAAAAPASQRSDLAKDTSYDSDKTESDVNDDDFEEIRDNEYHDNSNTDSDNDSDYDCNRKATPTATAKQELVAASSSSSRSSGTSAFKSGSKTSQKQKQHKKSKAKARETTDNTNGTAPKQSAVAAAAAAAVVTAAAAPTQHARNDAFDSGMKCVLCNDQPAEVIQVHMYNIENCTMLCIFAVPTLAVACCTVAHCRRVCLTDLLIYNTMVYLCDYAGTCRW